LSPNQYLLKLRLDKVKELLSNTNLSISEITYQTGFESVSYLSKLFKKKDKVTPRDYRNGKIT
jgi:transcriptional regulator GlxA family with amidase domain